MMQPIDAEVAVAFADARAAEVRIMDNLAEHDVPAGLFIPQQDVSIDSLLKRVQTHYENKEFSNALELLNRLEENPEVQREADTRTEVELYKVRVLEADSSQTLTIADIDRVLEHKRELKSNKNLGELKLYEGRVRMKQEDYKKAKGSFEEAIKNAQPDETIHKVQAHIELGDVLSEKLFEIENAQDNYIAAMSVAHERSKQGKDAFRRAARFNDFTDIEDSDMRVNMVEASIKFWRWSVDNPLKQMQLSVPYGKIGEFSKPDMDRGAVQMLKNNNIIHLADVLAIRMMEKLADGNYMHHIDQQVFYFPSKESFLEREIPEIQEALYWLNQVRATGSGKADKYEDAQDLICRLALGLGNLQKTEEYIERYEKNILDYKKMRLDWWMQRKGKKIHAINDMIKLLAKDNFDSFYNDAKIVMDVPKDSLSIEKHHELGQRAMNLIGEAINPFEKGQIDTARTKIINAIELNIKRYPGLDIEEAKERVRRDLRNHLYLGKKINEEVYDHKKNTSLWTGLQRPEIYRALVHHMKGNKITRNKHINEATRRKAKEVADSLFVDVIYKSQLRETTEYKRAMITAAKKLETAKAAAEETVMDEINDLARFRFSEMTRGKWRDKALKQLKFSINTASKTRSDSRFTQEFSTDIRYKAMRDDPTPFVGKLGGKADFTDGGQSMGGTLKFVLPFSRKFNVFLGADLNNYDEATSPILSSGPMKNLWIDSDLKVYSGFGLRKDHKLVVYYYQQMNHSVLSGTGSVLTPEIKLLEDAGYQLASESDFQDEYVGLSNHYALLGAQARLTQNIKAGADLIYMLNNTNGGTEYKGQALFEGTEVPFDASTHHDVTRNSYLFGLNGEFNLPLKILGKGYDLVLGGGTKLMLYSKFDKGEFNEYEGKVNIDNQELEMTSDFVDDNPELGKQLAMLDPNPVHSAYLMLKPRIPGGITLFVKGDVCGYLKEHRNHRLQVGIKYDLVKGKTVRQTALDLLPPIFRGE